MPNRWAVANGNWSSAATWSGSLIPTASDDVFTNTFTINMDTSINIRSLNNTATTGVTAGGTYNFNSGSISASISSTTSSLTAINSITVTAAVGTVTISAPNVSFVGGSSGVFQVINHSGNCNLIITASSFTGGSLSGANLINKASIGDIVLIGSLFGANGGVALTTTNGSTTIIGNVSSGTVSGISFAGTSLQINGNLIANNSAAAVSCTSAAIINITGSVIPSSAFPGLTSTGAHILTYSGSLASSAGSPAIISSNASATNIFTGPFINTNNTMAVQCVDMVLTQDASTFWNFGDITLYSPEQLAYYPSASDIRQGVTYADGTVSGSLAMPPPTAVIAGTPTDNTTGSAVLTATQLQNAFWGAPLSQMTDTGSIGARLAKSATLDSTGNQLASYLI